MLIQPNIRLKTPIAAGVRTSPVVVSASTLAAYRDNRERDVAKKRYPAFQFYPNDWLSSPKITLMTPAEEGAYIRLLSYCWEMDGLPNDDRQLAILSRLGEGWFNGGSTILRECFQLRKKDGKLVNKKLEKVKRNIKKWSEKSKQGGIASGKSRREKALSAKGCLPNGSTKPPTKTNSSSSSSIPSSVSEVNTDKKENPLSPPPIIDKPRTPAPNTGRHVNGLPSKNAGKIEEDMLPGLLHSLRIKTGLNSVQSAVLRIAGKYISIKDLKEKLGRCGPGTKTDRHREGKFYQILIDDLKKVAEGDDLILITTLWKNRDKRDKLKPKTEAETTLTQMGVIDEK